MLGIPLLGAIPEDQQVIISTNRGEPLVLQKKLSLSGIAFENAARRLIGKQDYFVDVQVRRELVTYCKQCCCWGTSMDERVCHAAMVLMSCGWKGATGNAQL